MDTEAAIGGGGDQPATTKGFIIGMGHHDTQRASVAE